MDVWSERAAVIILGVIAIAGMGLMAWRPQEFVGAMASGAMGALAMYVRPATRAPAAAAPQSGDAHP